MKRTKRILPALLMAFVFAMSFMACETDSISNEPETAVEEIAVDQETKFITKYFLGDEVKVRLEEDGTYSLAGGDTRLFENQLSDTADAFEENPEPQDDRSALALGGGVRKWPNSTIVYRISGLSSSVRSELQKSFNEWTSKTNVRFKERTNESNYVTISSSGSNSNSGVATLGVNGSRGFIRLGTRATAVVIIHEIGHTLGYIHEQNRSDRDNFVRINFNNIQDNAVDQFFKSNSASLVTSQFDINSTMMYGSYTFSKNGLPTITDLNGNVLPSRQARISSLDIQGTNSIYPPVGGDTGGDINACSGVEEWSPRRRYFVGDRVTYRGNLYERDFTRWSFIKQCG
ncbi:M12 family metallopeptidase [Maribacter sp. 2308TA10-17]|uniref:M12 family metallopeptidase n=1 Tax=Maribacter sp. 2308TA10-17 TaxID=3386276 RepID=UPI0039BCCE19